MNSVSEARMEVIFVPFYQRSLEPLERRKSRIEEIDKRNVHCFCDNENILCLSLHTFVRNSIQGNNVK